MPDGLQQHTMPRAQRLPRLGLSYLEAGSGTAVLLLHGWAAFKEIWWGTLRALAPRYRGVALEWPGHGTSPALEQVRGLDDLVELAARACAELGLAQVVAVGHSLGGRVAALLALAHPDLVTRLVLVDAALDPAYLAPFCRRMLELRAVERSVRLSRRLSAALRRVVASVPHEHGGGLIRPLLRRIYFNGLADPRALHAYVTALYAESLDQRLSAIRQPTLVVTGARDPLVHPAQARRAAQTIPQARLCVIPGAFHTPMDEQPAAFQRALLDFLERGVDGACP